MKIRPSSASFKHKNPFKAIAVYTLTSPRSIVHYTADIVEPACAGLTPVMGAGMQQRVTQVKSRL